MKKNIEKPKLNEDQLSFLAAHYRTLWDVSVDNNKKTIPRKQLRRVRDYVYALSANIEIGAWEEALRMAYRNPTFDEGFRSSIKMLIEAKREDTEGKLIDYDEMRLTALKLAKVYEYLTGKEVMTNKKIHKGALDD